MTKMTKPAIYLTERFQSAMAYATEQHKDQSRKSTTITYICHPFGVASLVLEAGGDEDQAIAALLHDVPEDCGGEPRLKRFFFHRKGIEQAQRGLPRLSSAPSAPYRGDKGHKDRWGRRCT